MGSLTSILMGVSSLLAGGRWLKEGLGSLGKAAREVVADEGGSGKKMKVRVYSVNTIEERIQHIQGMIRKGRDSPQIRKVTVQLLSKKCGKEWCTPEKNWKAEVVTIFNAVREHVRYVRDTVDKDLYQHPERTLEFGGADCDDFSIVLSSMLGAVGYPTKLRVIQTKGSQDWNHIYVLVGGPPRAPTKWVALDASVDKPAGWQAPKSMVARYRDFVVK